MMCSERRPAPRAVSVSSSWIRWVTDRAKRSRCTTTRVSPGAMPPSSLASAGRCLSAPEPYSWTFWAAGLAALERLGLLQRTKHRVLAIGANGGRVWKQLTSSYRLLIETVSREFSARTDSQIQEHIHVVEAVPGRAAQSAQEALRRVAERMLAKQRAAYRVV